MLKQYFKFAIRSILKHRSQSIISALGISIGLSCAILIIMYVQYENSYDNFHDNAGQIYRLVQKRPGMVSNGSDVYARLPGPLKYALANDIPEVKSASKLKFQTYTFNYKAKVFTERGFIFADSDFDKVFTFPVVTGDLESALKEPFSLFLTQEMAHKYFGDENPMGKVIKLNNRYDYTVKGILEDIPENSHLQFDFVSGMETWYSIRGGRDKVDAWDSSSFYTYVKLIDGIGREEMDGKLKSLVTQYLSDHDHPTEFIMQAVQGIHLGGNVNS